MRKTKLLSRKSFYDSVIRAEEVTLWQGETINLGNSFFFLFLQYRGVLAAHLDIPGV